MGCVEGEALLREGTNTRWVGALPSTSEPVHAGADEPCAETPRREDTREQWDLWRPRLVMCKFVECRKTDLMVFAVHVAERLDYNGWQRARACAINCRL